jgi:hypothetical protein
MYLCDDMIDLGFEEKAEWPTKAHREVNVPTGAPLACSSTSFSLTSLETDSERAQYWVVTIPKWI